MALAKYEILLRGTLRSHTDCVTAIASIGNYSEIVTASRDQSIIQWFSKKKVSVPRCDFTGHSQSIEDVAITSDGIFAISGGCDGELRLWFLEGAETVQSYVGHTDDVFSVAFSPDNRHIVSASRDRTIKLWDILGACKHTIENAHTDTVSCLRFVPRSSHHTVVSGSWDKTVKIWDLSDCKLRSTLIGHTGYVNAVSVSPDGTLCASGGQDGVILLWDVDEGKRLLSFDAGSVTHAICFSPSRYWICVATEAGIKVWDLENKCTVADLKVDLKQEREMRGEEGVGDDAEVEEKEKEIYCTSLCWSDDGDTLFGGYTDGVVRLWGVGQKNDIEHEKPAHETHENGQNDHNTLVLNTDTEFNTEYFDYFGPFVDFVRLICRGLYHFSKA